MKNWIDKKVKELCNVGRGRVISQSEINESVGIYPVYSSQSQNNGEMGKINTYDFDGEYVTWTTDGAYAGTVFYRTGKFNCTNVCGTLKVKEESKLNSKFFAYLLSTVAQNYVTYLGNPKLMNGVMGEIELSLPSSLPEQTRIAEILSKADEAIAQTEALIAKYQRIKTGLMQDLLTRGIDENGNIRSKATHKFVVKNGIEVPVEWEVLNLVEFGKSKYYLRTGPFGSSLKISDWVENGIPVITIGSLGDNAINTNQLLYITEEKADSLNVYQLQEGDILFSRVADVGRSIVIQEVQKGWIMSSNFMRLRINENKVLSKYLHMNLSTSFVKTQIRQSSNSGGRDLVNSEILNKIYFKVPPVSEQHKILDKINQIDKLIDDEQTHLTKLHSLKRGLMQDLLSGQVRVKV